MSATVPTTEEFQTLCDRVTDLEARLAATAQPWPEWMNIETAARYLDLTPDAVRKRADRGALPSHQEGPGCRIFFNRHELDQAMHG